MSQPSIDRIRDVALWFHENKDRGRDMHKEIEFLHKSIDMCLLVMSHLLEDIQHLEGRSGRSPLLYTPNGVTWRENHGD